MPYKNKIWVNCPKCGFHKQSRVKFMCMTCYQKFPSERTKYRERKYRKRYGTKPFAHCLHCMNARQIIGRRLCQRCYKDETIRPKYPASRVYRDWNGREIAELRRFAHFKTPLAYQAQALGRTVVQVREARRRAGIASYHKLTPTLIGRIVKAVQGGSSDRQAAELAGVHRCTVQKLRKKLGIPRGCSPAKAEKIAQSGRLAKWGRLGRDWPYHRRYVDARSQAVRDGWPAGTSGGQAKILNALKSGPLKVRAIADAIGHKGISSVTKFTRELRKIGILLRNGKRTGSGGYLWEINWDMVRRLRDASGNEYEKILEKSGNYVADWHEAG